MKSKFVTILAVLGIVTTALLFTLGLSQADVTWPPRLGQPYPDLRLVDQTGRTVTMSSFKGKVILVEYVGMNCAACQAFSGAHDRGAFEKVQPQRGIRSIEKLLPRFAGGLSLDDERIIFVQVLLYSMSMGAPTTEDARRWAEHFQLDRSKDEVVLAGKKELLGRDSYNLIPGFQLVDKNFIVRSDSTGHNPRDNLYTELLPKVRELVEESASASNAAFADESAIRTAYRAIPHRRTVFDKGAAKMSTDEKTYLDDFFRLVDSAMVERVQMAQWISSGGRQGKNTAKYDLILEELKALDPPSSSLNKLQDLVIEAIVEQRALLDEWKESERAQFPKNNPRVRKASSQLRRAYSLLLKQFPREGPHNREAFFDYLCALDFI